MNKNEKFACGFRLVLGGWLVYIGISLLWTVNKEKPANMFFMATMGMICMVIGAVYAGWIVKRLLAIRKAERQETAEVTPLALDQADLSQEPRKEPVDVTLKAQTEENDEAVPESKNTDGMSQAAAADPEPEKVEASSEVDGNVADAGTAEKDETGKIAEQEEDDSKAVQQEAEHREEIENDYEEK